MLMKYTAILYRFHLLEIKTHRSDFGNESVSVMDVLF